MIKGAHGLSLPMISLVRSSPQIQIEKEILSLNFDPFDSIFENYHFRTIISMQFIDSCLVGDFSFPGSRVSVSDNFA